MPVDYHIDSGTLVVNMHGTVTSQEFATYLTDTARDPRYLPTMDRLVIISRDAVFPPSNEIIRYAARTPERKLGPRVRFACVAETPLGIGISSMFMGHAGLGDNYQVFRSEQDARDWLRRGDPPSEN